MKQNRASLFIYQIMRFGIVGLSAAIIHLNVVVFLVQLFNFQPLIANLYGFCFGFMVSYGGHRFWTFNQTAVLHRVALPKLFFIQMANLAVNELLFYILLSLQLPYFLALLLVLSILPIFTFFTTKRWVFPDY